MYKRGSGDHSASASRHLFSSCCLCAVLQFGLGCNDLGEAKAQNNQSTECNQKSVEQNVKE